MTDFHKKYKRVNRFWQDAEFTLLEDVIIKTYIVGFEYEDDYAKLDKYGNLTVKKGFYFGASGCTFDTESCRLAACIHDALYWISQCGGFRRTYDDHTPDDFAIRLEADMIFYDLCIDNGMYVWRANLWLHFLRRYGKKAWKADPE